MEELMYVLIAKVLRGEATDAERREVDAWIHASEVNATAYQSLKEAWEQTEWLLAGTRYDAEAAWGSVAKKLNFSDASFPGSQSRPAIFAFPRWIKYGFAAAAVLILSVFIWNPFSIQPNELHEVVARKGHERVVLPDQSVITLRLGSKITYPEHFEAAQRRVSLDGEAFFEVTRNEENPFIIDAGIAEVRVLGTTFNVKVGLDVADVVVTTGRVQVKGANSMQTVILNPGQAVHVTPKSLEEVPTIGNETYWRDSLLKFSNQPFAQVVAVISQVKGIGIQFSPEITSVRRQQRITIRFGNQSVKEILTELCLITNTSWKEQKEGFVIAPQ